MSYGDLLREYYEVHMRLDDTNYDLCALDLYEFANEELDKPIEVYFKDFAHKVIDWFNRYWVAEDDLTSFHPSLNVRRKDSFDFARSCADFQQLLSEHDMLMSYDSCMVGDLG